MGNSIKKSITKQQTLFSLEQIPINNDYIFPSEKRKWTIEFVNWCTKKYLLEADMYGIFCCGNMRICDYCQMKLLDGCKDCVEAIKKFYRSAKQPIPYRNYNFQEILNEVEGK